MANERSALTDDQVKHMVNRFLGWKLPDDFTPDSGVSFKPILRDGQPWPEVWPVGTNLLMASQAEAMVRYMVEGLQHGGVCLWCGFSTTNDSLDELTDAIYTHLGECDAAPVPALIRERNAARMEVLALREALSDYGRHIQSIPELGIVGCDFDPEEGTVCTCGLTEAISNTSATAQQVRAEIEREALEEAWYLVENACANGRVSIPPDQAYAVRAAILGEQEKE